MAFILLKYGHDTIKVRVPDKNLIGVFVPRHVPGVSDVTDEIERALEHPIGSPKLEDLVRKGEKVTILVDDITRFVPNDKILPPLIKRLTSSGIKLTDITIVIARGAHRPSTEDEIKNFFQKEWIGKVKYENHDPDTKEKLAYLGKSSLGTEVYINRTVKESDFCILTGDIEIHQFVGFGGGAKSIFPGIANRAAIEMSHSRMEMKGTGAGILYGNPVREEIDEVGRMLPRTFLLNVVMNGEREVIKAFAGDIYEAFVKGTELCKYIYEVKIPEKADIVLASAGGYPKDIELYQAQKALNSAVKAVKKGIGKVVLIAQCKEGHGDKKFHEWMMDAECLDDIIERVKKRFVLGGHKAYQYARELRQADVYLYSDIDKEQAKKYFLKPVEDINQIEKIVEEGRVIVLPQATLSLVSLN